ncbi:hypothetical protein AB0H28_20775 [Micromonospora sp. NPDC050980]|uniref:hypothetical protein n=1 Tax=Micromonospora sp. NPDC050980 TaxID=3155161 RepID=UPI0034003017
MRSRVATTAAVVITVPSGLLALLGCLGFLPFLAPTEPCPNESADSFRQAMILLFLLSMVMLLAALLSIALAWAGRWTQVRNPWPWLALSVLPMAVSAGMIVPIDRLGSC